MQTEDDTGRLDLVFFHAERKFIERQLPVGEERYVSGRIERYGESLQMSHPDYIVAPAQRDELPLLEPVETRCRHSRTADEVRAAFSKWIDPANFVQVVRGPTPQ